MSIDKILWKIENSGVIPVEHWRNFSTDMKIY